MATLVKRDSGRWQAKVRRKGLPPISKTFSTKAEALAWARMEESSQDHGTWRDRSSAESTTLHALLDQYARDVVPSKRGAEIEQIRIKTLQRDPISRFKLAALTPPVVAQWRDARLSAGAQGSTVNRELGMLSAVLNWARMELMIAIENSVSSVRRPPPGKARDRRLEGDEEQRLLESLEDRAMLTKGGKREGNYRTGGRNPWMRPLVRFAIETAMRQGELLSLRWEHVDLRTRTAHLKNTKNGEARTVPLSSRAVAVLEVLPHSIDGRVFPITAQAVKLAWGRACRRAGIEGLHFHDLRHEATSRLAERLPNLIELAAVTGHKDLRMLKRYYHPRATDLARKLG